MHDQEKSDSAIVAVKSPNKTGFPVSEAMERRAGTKGNADKADMGETIEIAVSPRESTNPVRIGSAVGEQGTFHSLIPAKNSLIM